MSLRKTLFEHAWQNYRKNNLQLRGNAEARKNCTVNVTRPMIIVIEILTSNIMSIY